ELERVLKAPRTVSDFIEHSYENARNECYLGKAWHAIHFSLTGDPWEGESPHSRAVLGGTPIGDVDVRGFGPARYLMPAQVRGAAVALSAIPLDGLRQDFSLPEMIEAEIYAVDDRSTEDDEWEFVRGYYQHMVAFYQEAARAGEAVVFWIH